MTSTKTPFRNKVMVTGSGIWHGYLLGTHIFSLPQAQGTQQKEKIKGELLPCERGMQPPRPTPLPPKPPTSHPSAVLWASQSQPLPKPVCKTLPLVLGLFSCLLRDEGMRGGGCPSAAPHSTNLAPQNPGIRREERQGRAGKHAVLPCLRREVRTFGQGRLRLRTRPQRCTRRRAHG